MKDFAEVVASWPTELAKLDRRDRAMMTTRACFVLGDTENWLRSQNVLARLLSEEDLAGLAYICLRSLPTETAYDVAERANGHHSDWFRHWTSRCVRSAEYHASMGSWCL